MGFIKARNERVDMYGLSMLADRNWLGRHVDSWGADRNLTGRCEVSW